MAAPLKTIISEYMFAYNTKILRDAIDAAEVKDVCITEYDEKAEQELFVNT